jgi:hypothetical protein
VTNMYTLHAFFGQYDKCETYCERITNATPWPHTSFEDVIVVTHEPLVREEGMQHDGHLIRRGLTKSKIRMRIQCASQLTVV